jgi:hypothetical protein
MTLRIYVMSVFLYIFSTARLERRVIVTPCYFIP